MNYAAVNAKVRAMSARLTKPQDYESVIAEIESEANLRQGITQAAVSICRYIPQKAQKSFVIAAATPAEDLITYYMAQWKKLSQMDKPNRIAIKGILGAEIDLTNILWIHRLKRYHRIKGSETYGYLIPIRHKLSPAETQHMAEAGTQKALFDVVAAGPYGMDYKHVITQQHISPEQALANIIDAKYQSAARRHLNTLAPTLAYLHRKKLEVNGLITTMQRSTQW